MTSAFRDHSVSVRSLGDPSLSLLRGTLRAGCDVVHLSDEAEEMAGVRLTQRAATALTNKAVAAFFIQLEREIITCGKVAGP